MRSTERQITAPGRTERGTTGVSDLALIRRVQQGDRSAFDLLVAKYQHKILNLVMRYVKDPSEALDVAQEAFLKAYRAAPSFRGESAFYTWLYRIAINTAKNYLVAARRRPAGVDVDFTDSDQFEALTKLADIDRRIAELHEMRDALARLARGCESGEALGSCPFLDELGRPLDEKSQSCCDEEKCA